MLDTKWRVTVTRNEKPLHTVYDFVTREEAQYYADAEINESITEAVEAVEICNSCERRFGHGHESDCKVAKSVDSARRSHHDSGAEWDLHGDPTTEQDRIYQQITT